MRRIYMMLVDLSRIFKYLLSFKLKYMKNTSNSHLKENSSISASKLHNVVGGDL
jgi:hypothetical protein